MKSHHFFIRPEEYEAPKGRKKTTRKKREQLQILIIVPKVGVKIGFGYTEKNLPF